VIENTPNGKFEQLKSPSSSSVLLLLFEEENNQEVQVVAELDDDDDDEGIWHLFQARFCTATAVAFEPLFLPYT
jgi:hypothetical protein